MAAPPAYYAPVGGSRPIGVTILAVLTILIGILIVLAGIVLVAAPLLLTGFGLPLAFGLAASVLGGIVLLVGILWVGTGVGLLRLRGWAWWLAVIVMVISIVGSIGTLVAAIVPGLILVYLILVRRHFR